MKHLFFISLIIIATSFIFSSRETYAQTCIHPKISGLGYHPFESPNKPQLYENKLDANGHYVLEPLVIISIENFLRGDYFSWRFMFGGQADVISQPAMFFNLGLKYRFFQKWRSSFDIAAGPVLLLREDWNSVDGYNAENIPFNVNGKWQNRFDILGELEYKYYLSDHMDITASVLYGHQLRTFTFTLGTRFWLSTTIKHPGKCGSCPFDDVKMKKRRR